MAHGPKIGPPRKLSGELLQRITEASKPSKSLAAKHLRELRLIERKIDRLIEKSEPRIKHLKLIDNKKVETISAEIDLSNYLHYHPEFRKIIMHRYLLAGWTDIAWGTFDKEENAITKIIFFGVY